MAINVSDNNPRINYTATSGQTVFTVPFEFFASTDLTVYVGGSVLSASNYTVTGGSGSTGSITTNSGQSAGAEIAIVRDVPLERTTDLTSTYSASSLNDQLDRLVVQVADLDDRVSRSISLNDYEVGVSLDLPATASRLGKTIQFNSSTGALEIGPSGDELTSIASIASEITALDGIKANITTVAGSISNVNSVGSNISSVTSVASSISNVNTVNTNIANVNSVAGSISDLNDVADSLDQVELVGGSISNVDIVGPAIANVNTVAGDISNINTVAGISANITTVAGITADISTVNSNSTNINLVATNMDDVNDVANVITKVTTVADNIANVNTVAPSVGYLSTVANNISNINTLAPISADITTVAGVAGSVSSAAANAAAAESAKVAAEAAQAAAELAADTFEDTYLGAKASDPLTDNDGDALNAGDLYFNTGSNVLKVYDGSSWAAAALDASGYITIAGGTLTDNLSFGDNDKAIFGAGSDLQIYHDGSHSYIKDNGTGNLLIQGSAAIVLEDPDGNNMIYAEDGGPVYLYSNGSQKLATTSTGVNITGTLTSDGLTVDGTGVEVISVNSTQNGAQINFDSASTSVDWSIGVSNSADGDFLIYQSGSGSGDINLYTGGLKRQEINRNGDISFYEDTGTTAKFFWDASAERLSIGTNISTETPLTVYKTTPVGGYATALFRNSAVAGEGNGILVDVQNTPHSYIADFRINNSSKVRIDSSGRVGIGTSSPSESLTNRGNIFIETNSTSANSGNGLFWQSTTNGWSTSTAHAAIYGKRTDASNGYLRFDTRQSGSATEAMRIDSSGNLLVGKTAQSVDTVGGEILSTGIGQFTVDGNFAGRFTRKGVSDGDIVVFRKGTGTVGSIGSSYGDRINIGTGNTGVMFRTSSRSIDPADPSTGLITDNLISLGRSGVTYKDLYLSGGVYLGGTGSANKLDDYEEGTWTAQLSDGTNISSTTATGYYTKVGRIVHCMVAKFTNISTSGLSGFLRLSLPFTPATGGFYSSGTAVMFSGTFPSNTYALRASIYHGETRAYLQAVGTSGASSLSTSNITSGATDIDQITFSYITS